MQYLIAVLGFLLALPSCQDKREITIEFEKANGLKVNTPLELNAVNAGMVSKISTAKENQILAVVRLNDGLEIPADSKFIFVESDSLIVVERGTSTVLLTGGERLTGIHRRSNIIDIF